jgi:hypothetical protein
MLRVTNFMGELKLGRSPALMLILCIEDKLHFKGEV